MIDLPQISPAWRTRGLIALGAVLALVVAFSAGRFSAPTKVETRDVERVVFKDKIVTVEKVVTVREAAKATVIWRDRVITKDGTITEHTIEKSASDTKVSVADNTSRTATLDDSRTTESVKTVTNLPRWRVGVLVGAQYPLPLVPIAGPLVLGAIGEFRIIGGLSAGLWVTTGFAGGLIISFQF